MLILYHIESYDFQGRRDEIYAIDLADSSRFTSSNLGEYFAVRWIIIDTYKILRTKISLQF